MKKWKTTPPGTLDLLILKALSWAPLHGVGVATRIEQITGGAFSVSYGSLFPCLHQMEEKGWLKAEWGVSENNRRAKYYQLTSVGRGRLKMEEEDWRRMTKVIDLALRSG